MTKKPHDSETAGNAGNGTSVADFKFVKDALYDNSNLFWDGTHKVNDWTPSTPLIRVHPDGDVAILGVRFTREQCVRALEKIKASLAADSDPRALVNVLREDK